VIRAMYMSQQAKQTFRTRMTSLDLVLKSGDGRSVLSDRGPC